MSRKTCVCTHVEASILTAATRRAASYIIISYISLCDVDGSELASGANAVMVSAKHN